MWHIRTHEAVSSTQDVLKGLGDAPEGTIVQALVQNAGRGRHGRFWTSEKGNLYMSVLLKPDCVATQIGQLAIVVGLAVAQGIRGFVADPAALCLKWPNDVLIHNSKCAGILLETALQGAKVAQAYIGIGVNVAAAPAEAAALGAQAQVDVVRDAILAQLAVLYKEWTSAGFCGMRDAWLKLSYEKGTPMAVNIAGQRVQGAFQGIDDNGNLLLDGADGLRTITAGDVFV